MLIVLETSIRRAKLRGETLTREKLTGENLTGERLRHNLPVAKKDSSCRNKQKIRTIAALNQWIHWKRFVAFLSYYGFEHLPILVEKYKYIYLNLNPNLLQSKDVSWHMQGKNIAALFVFKVQVSKYSFLFPCRTCFRFFSRLHALRHKTQNHFLIPIAHFEIDQFEEVPPISGNGPFWELTVH